MLKKLFVSAFIMISLTSYPQEFGESLIKEMSWGLDLKIQLKMENDSIYIYDIQNLYKVDGSQSEIPNAYTYYPVNLSEEFSKKLMSKGVELGIDTVATDSSIKAKATVQTNNKTLWSSLNGYIGGGWIHFVNTMLYTLESESLTLTSPLLKRPISNWKPKPMTESFKRTKNWDYYLPVKQKDAIKEYLRKKEANELGDLKLLPEPWIEQFMKTSDKQLAKLRYYNKRQAAQINLIKLLTGANYLGEMQIYYIKSMVMKAVSQYSRTKLPSVIIFENYNAAVAMNLNENGYQIEKIIFKDIEDITQETIDVRTKTITGIIQNINNVNKELFQERLKQYYK